MDTSNCKRQSFSPMFLPLVFGLLLLSGISQSEELSDEPETPIALLTTAEKMSLKKCNRDIGFCTRQNIDIFSIFIHTILSIDVESVTNEEAHLITTNVSGIIFIKKIEF